MAVSWRDGSCTRAVHHGGMLMKTRVVRQVNRKSEESCPKSDSSTLFLCTTTCGGHDETVSPGRKKHHLMVEIHYEKGKEHEHCHLWSQWCDRENLNETSPGLRTSSDGSDSSPGSLPTTRRPLERDGWRCVRSRVG